MTLGIVMNLPCLAAGAALASPPDPSQVNVTLSHRSALETGQGNTNRCVLQRHLPHPPPRAKFSNHCEKGLSCMWKNDSERDLPVEGPGRRVRFPSFDSWLPRGKNENNCWALLPYAVSSWFWFSGSWECSAISMAVKSVFIRDFWDKPLLSILITFLSLIWFSLCPQIQFPSKFYQLLVKPPPEHMQYTAFLCGINCSSNSRGPQPPPSLRASSPHEKRRESLSVSRPPRPWGRCHAGLSPAERAAKGPGTSWRTALPAVP